MTLSTLTKGILTNRRGEIPFIQTIKYEDKMKNTLIQNAITIVQSKIIETTDIEEVSFFEGAFSILEELQNQNEPNEDLFKQYLSDFIREDGIEREILTDEAPQLLAELGKLLSS